MRLVTLRTPGGPRPAVVATVDGVDRAVELPFAAAVVDVLADGVVEGRRIFANTLKYVPLNTAWSVLFWRIRKPWVAAAEAALLTASSADLARRAGTVSKGAGIALSPYAGWCGFATALSTAIARRNR